MNGSCLAISHQSGTVRDTRDFTSGPPSQILAVNLSDLEPEVDPSSSTPSVEMVRANRHARERHSLTAR